MCDSQNTLEDIHENQDDLTSTAYQSPGNLINNSSRKKHKSYERINLNQICLVMEYMEADLD